ncbi:MAG: hypothetical protein HY282_08455 [Nitrospirae bacterium]|nr:hypothetical protein [Candidatus Manganitrophaceae bacterium]
MSKKVRALIIITGLVIFFSWGFRLYVLYLHWGNDPFMTPHAAVAVISFAIGAFLLSMGIRGSKSTRRDYTILTGAALFTVLWWGFRAIKVLLHPESDPNPTAHLHLSVLFIVLGALLLTAGWQGRNRVSTS